MTEITSRTWITALKTDKNKESWTNQERISNLLKEYKGLAEIYTITHKPGTKQEHQHFLIIFKTPRKISTVANIFNVETHMISKCINKKSQLRYLIHADNPEKEQYNEDEVLTNSKHSYIEQTMKEEFTEMDIYRYLKENGIQNAYKLLPVANASKINNIIKLIKTSL